MSVCTCLLACLLSFSQPSNFANKLIVHAHASLFHHRRSTFHIGFARVTDKQCNLCFLYGHSIRSTKCALSQLTAALPSGMPPPILAIAPTDIAHELLLLLRFHHRVGKRWPAMEDIRSPNISLYLQTHPPVHRRLACTCVSITAAISSL